MGYGNDDSEMIIELPSLTHTFTTLIILATSESDYSSYGGNDQLIIDLASSLSVNAENFKIDSSI
jgi:hypothetical protein